MEYQEQGEPWLQVKLMPLSQLELNQWRLFDPTLPLPGGLLWNRFLNWLTMGKIARDMLKGNFPGSGPGRRIPLFYAQQWFRFAAHSVAIRPTADGLYQRAISGTINAGDTLHHQEYLGFDGNGREIRYDYTYGFIDLEVVIRRWPPSPKSLVLQGVLLFKVLAAGVSPRTPELIRLTQDLLAHETEGIPDRLRQAVSECRGKL